MPHRWAEVVEGREGASYPTQEIGGGGKACLHIVLWEGALCLLCVLGEFF